ncbi:MAG: hypothetical protein EXS32_12395 [Opitutus sp.]|nr:hypothetical protein [Opitutus sp.]
MVYNPSNGKTWVIRTATSADGIHWKAAAGYGIDRFLETASFYRFNDLYVVNGQRATFSDGGHPGGRQGRAILSTDFETWLNGDTGAFLLPEPSKPADRGSRKPYDQVHLGVGAASFGSVAVGLYGIWHNAPGDEARRLSLAFQIAHPTLPGPRIELLHAYLDAGERDRADREADALIRDFPADPLALLALANFAANTANPTLARRLTDHAKALRLPWEAHAILAVEALVVARDFSGALDAVRDLLRENPTWATSYTALLNSLQAIAHYGRGDSETGHLFLLKFLQPSDLRAENLLAIARRLTEVEAGEEARQTLERASAADPLNQAALTRLVELDLNLNRLDELPVHLRRLVAMRRPSADVLRVAQHKLGSDHFLFSADRTATLEAVRLALERTARGAPR